MTIRDITKVVDSDITIVAQKDGATVASFEVAYTDSIIDEILDTEVGWIDVSAAYKGSTTLTISEESEDGGDDGDGNDGGDTEPDDEQP